MTPLLGALGAGAVHLLAALLCLVGIAVSGLSLSGTWLVVLAAVAEALVPGGPGWGTAAIFALGSLAVEAAEALSGFWGVRRRGGSARTGGGAILGGLVGMAAGSAVGPLAGSAAGAVVGSFIGAYLVEILRHSRKPGAARIAWGAVTARLLMTGLKVGAALLMSIWLFVAILAR